MKRGMTRSVLLKARRIGFLCGILGGLMALCSCQHAQVKLADGDLLQQAREWRQQEGMAAARDRLLVRLEQLDADGGGLEQRLLRTNADKQRVYPDSMAALPRSQRQRTGIYFLYGFHTRGELSKNIAAQVVASLCQQGWHARLIDLTPHETVEQDARRVRRVMERELPQVDRAVLVGFSKGALDWIQWFAHEAGQLPSDQIGKVRLLVSFAGVLRGSVVADWLYRGGVPFAHTVRQFVRLHRDGKKTLEDVRSISRDPWTQDPEPQLRQVAPRLRVVSLVAIADGPGGHPREHRGFRFLSRLVATQWHWVGPLDGMTESASQVLPPGTGVEQHLIRVLGSHALLDGRYVNGAEVSANFLHQKDQSHAGEEPLDDLLRCLPQAWVMR